MGEEASPEREAFAMAPTFTLLGKPIRTPVLAPGKAFRRPAPGLGPAHMSLLFLAASLVLWRRGARVNAGINGGIGRCRLDALAVGVRHVYFFNGAIRVPGTGYAPRTPAVARYRHRAQGLQANGRAHVKLPSRFLYREAGNIDDPATWCRRNYSPVRLIGSVTSRLWVGHLPLPSEFLIVSVNRGVGYDCSLWGGGSVHNGGPPSVLGP